MFFIEKKMLKLYRKILLATNHGVMPSSMNDDPLSQFNHFLLKFDGADGASDFVDSSGNGTSITRVGNVVISSAKKKFGNGSARFNGVGNFLYSPAALLSSLLETSEWTIEAIYSRDTPANAHGIIGQGKYGSNNQFSIERSSSQIACTLNNGSSTIAGLSAVPDEPNEWVHTAVVRKEGVNKLYHKGLLIGQNAVLPSISTTNNVVMGLVAMNNTGYRSLVGNIQVIRITTKARYLDEFNTETDTYLGW